MTVNGGFQTWANHTHYLGVGFRLIRVGIVYCTAYSLCWLRGLVHKGKLMTSRWGRSGTWLKGVSNVSHIQSILQVEFVAASKFKKKQPASKNDLLPRRISQSGSNYMQLSSFAMRPSSTWASRPGWQNFSDRMTGWLKTGRWFGTWLDYDFPYIENVIIPTDFHSIIFQRGRAKNHQPAICSYMFPWFMGKISHMSICFLQSPHDFPPENSDATGFFRADFQLCITRFSRVKPISKNWLLMVIPRDSYDIYIVYYMFYVCVLWCTVYEYIYIYIYYYYCYYYYYT